MTKYEEFLAVGDKTKKESAVATGVGVTTVTGIIALIQVFLPDLLTDKQVTLILVLAALITPIVTAVLIRGKVWSIASVNEVIDEAVENALEAANTPPKNSGVSKLSSLPPYPKNERL